MGIYRQWDLINHKHYSICHENLLLEAIHLVKEVELQIDKHKKPSILYTV